ncbi:CHAT domain-containing protein [Streptomyces sp. NPDC057424]|uniref:CHAT domain-containing protein n=1 Tax=Streptomyces sp. NPDC057424 TaxID=3346127 RepID=UPI0036AF4BF0
MPFTEARLTQALLLGGSRTVIAGQWRVADGSGAALFSVFHRQLAGGHGSAATLHPAARAVAGRSPDRRHFCHWGAFIAVPSGGCPWRTPPQTSLLHHPHHEPRPGHPHLHHTSSTPDGKGLDHGRGGSVGSSRAVTRAPSSWAGAVRSRSRPKWSASALRWSRQTASASCE